ncbi:flagellar transcriptional regulator FlhD [Hydrogenophilus thiooxidans]|uniref:flagellar transcriptional regulator FlhD n=1 Tax=Hydrogenophilus thiooxidans TaxID=2820326 RepID=UPI001C24FED8|nr:flagellar transcriptional regulator FlhD [Hydrogenophilus thiooxidans]
MPAPDFAEEIRELNLNFLILAQRMAHENVTAAAVKLGVAEEDLRWLQALSPAKLVRLAQGAMLVPQFRFDGELLQQLAGDVGRDEAAAQLHALIVAQTRSRKKRIVGDSDGEKT